MSASDSVRIDRSFSRLLACRLDVVKSCAVLNGNDPYNNKGGIEVYTVQLIELLKSAGIHVDLFFPGRLPGVPSADATNRPGAWSNISRKFRHARWNFSSRGDETGTSASEIAKLSPHLAGLLSLGQKFSEVQQNYDFAVCNSFFAYGYTNPRIPTYTILHSTFVGYAEANREIFSPKQFEVEMNHRGRGAERLSTTGKRIIAVSPHVAAEARAFYGARRVFTVPSAVDEAIFFPRPDWRELRDSYGIPRKAFVGVFVGRWGPDKAIDVLEAVIPRTPGTVWLLILSDATRCRLKETETLRILSGQSSENVARLMNMGDFLFHPARYEGFGMVFAEALACGLPIIAPPVGIMRQVGAEEPFAPLLLPGYGEGRDRVVDAAVATIDRLQGDRDLARRIRRAGPKYANRVFNKGEWDRRMRRVLGI